MRGILDFFLGLLFYEVVSTAHYFHEPSHIQLTSPNEDMDFGSTLNYHKKTSNLVVGAPKSDINGKVFTCLLTDIAKNTKIKCKRANINIDKDAEDFRKPPIGLPDQPCHLGASIAVTDDNIFTCAPLCSKHISDQSSEKNNSSKVGAFGTCFVYNGKNAKRYRGLYETHNPAISKSTKKFHGGVGWTTFADPKNHIILIAKYILDNYITYLNMNHLLQPVSERDMPKEELPMYNNKGLAFTAGIYFNNKKYLYAFSMKNFNHCGGIAFMYYEEDSLKILQDDDETKAILIRDPHSISMYGSALHSADLNNDNFSELIVGAPAFSSEEGVYDLGAIYLYKGGGEVIERSEPTLRIVATEEAARFGTSIASTDLDGDGFAEIFVSSPYRKKEGAVHILFGYEIRKLMDSTIRDYLLSSLKDTQTLLIENFKTFGYSLHAFERNGDNLLAVGAPDIGKVALYRSLPLVRVSMSMRVLGDKSVRERDTSFTVIVNVKLENSGKSLNSTFKLILSTEVTGNLANIEGNTTNEIELSKTNPESSSHVVVLLGETGPGDYKVTARVFDKEPFKQKDYDTASVQLTPHSETISVLEVPRHCKGDDCVPKLITTIQWSGGSETYILGSNRSETIQLMINNEGNSTYDSCAWIKLTGAQIGVLECNGLSHVPTADGTSYKCHLQIERNDNHIIPIRLDMSLPTNKYKSLNIEVHLFNHCALFNSNATDITKKEIVYIFNNDDIEIEGSSFNRSFTDSEIHNDVPNAIVQIHESYKITNTAIISWYKIVAVLKYQDLPFIEKYMILDKECKQNKSNGYVEMKCIIDIGSMSDEFLYTTAVLSKSKLIPYLKQRKLVLNSTMELHFDSTSSKIAYYTTTIFVQRDAGLWENQYFLIGISVIVAVVIVGILVLILYKIGFFERKKKEKSKILRESIRRPSVPNKKEENITSI